MHRGRKIMSRWTNIFGGAAKPQQEGAPSISPTTPTSPTPTSDAESHESLGAHFGEAAQAATTALGRRMQAMARDINERSGGVIGTLARRHVPGGVMVGVASHAVAAGLEHGGKFLESEGLQGVVKNVTEQMKRNPIPVLLLGIGLGFLAGRKTRAGNS